MKPGIRSGLLLGAALMLAAETVSAETHLNRPLPEQHVIVNFFQMPGGICPDGAGSTLRFYRILPSGAQIPFQIPFGFYFVVTDFDLTTYAPGLRATDSIETLLRLFPSGASSGPIVHRSSFHLVADLSSDNFTVNHQSLAGMMVGPAATLCPEMHADAGASGLEELMVTSGVYRGYFVPISRVQPRS
jgi:hypothetical protein